jgi:hypothetical protein
MSAAMAMWQKHRSVVLVDVILLLALYLVPSISHLTAIPLYQFEPMRVALLVALLFTNRTNTYFIAVTLPLASVVTTGHPEPLKAVLMAIEFLVLVAAYGFLVRRLRIPVVAALAAAILVSKVIYYTMKYVALDAGWLSGSLISTPLQTQLVLALGTAALFGLVEHARKRKKQAP